MNQLDDMALFVEVVKANGFRNAAKLTGVPNSTISRRISGLEKRIGLRLLQRTNRQLKLTEVGEIYFNRCKHLIDEANLIHEHLNELRRSPIGKLRISVPVDFCIEYVAPFLVEFGDMYPEIDFDIDLTSRNVDLFSEAYDLAIRMGNLHDSQLIARPLTRLELNLYASAHYIRQAGNPEKPEDLAKHQCIEIMGGKYWTLHNGDLKKRVEVGSRYTVNNMGMVRKLCVHHQGIILMPEKAVLSFLNSGQLIRVLPEWKGPSLLVSAITASRLLPAKAQIFLDFLRKKMSELPE